jgi:hypothetical protein
MPLIRRTTRLDVDAGFPPEVRRARFAALARENRDRYIAAGQAAPVYTTFVDGVKGAAEERVRLDGVIVYRFSPLGPATLFAVTTAIKLSPVKSGAYRRAWFVSVDGRRYAGDFRDIPAGAEVMITNDADYHRKITVGAQGAYVPPGIVETVEREVRRRFPSLETDVQYVTIPGGYVLKGRPRGVRRRGSDLKKGARMTYPAIVFKVRR